jgi:hypothetical protein
LQPIAIGPPRQIRRMALLRLIAFFTNAFYEQDVLPNGLVPQ